MLAKFPALSPAQFVQRALELFTDPAKLREFVLFTDEAFLDWDTFFAPHVCPILGFKDALSFKFVKTDPPIDAPHLDDRVPSTPTVTMFYKNSSLDPDWFGHGGVRGGPGVKVLKSVPQTFPPAMKGDLGRIPQKTIDGLLKSLSHVFQPEVRNWYTHVLLGQRSLGLEYGLEPPASGKMGKPARWVIGATSVNLNVVSMSPQTLFTYRNSPVSYSALPPPSPPAELAPSDFSFPKAVITNSQKGRPPAQKTERSLWIASARESLREFSGGAALKPSAKTKVLKTLLEGYDRSSSKTVTAATDEAKTSSKRKKASSNSRPSKSSKTSAETPAAPSASLSSPLAPPGLPFPFPFLVMGPPFPFSTSSSADPLVLPFVYPPALVARPPLPVSSSTSVASLSTTSMPISVSNSLNAPVSSLPSVSSPLSHSATGSKTVCASGNCRDPSTVNGDLGWECPRSACQRRFHLACGDHRRSKTRTFPCSMCSRCACCDQAIDGKARGNLFALVVLSNGFPSAFVFASAAHSRKCRSCFAETLYSVSCAKKLTICIRCRAVI